jgi:hypothetical protein
VAVATMLSTAQALVGTKYTYGGGHNGWDPISELKKIGVDCSGFVSQVLHAGGVSMPGPQSTQGLPSYLQKGAGGKNGVTVYDRTTGPTADEHTIMEIMGKWFESGGNSKYNPSGGVTNLTAAQAGGELAGGGFQAYHPLYSSKVATNAQLQALGISSSASSSTVNINNLIAAAKTAIASTASSLITKYGNANQSGTNRTLESALGVNTGRAIAPGGVSGQAAITFNQNTLATVMHGIIEKLGPGASISKINKATSGSIAQGMAGSPQDKAYQQDVLNLIATGQTKMAQELVAAHKAAMATLGQEMYAQQTTADADQIQLQATQLKDQTTLIADSAANQLTVVKAQAQQVNDQATAQTQYIRDMTTVAQDQFAAMATAVKDQTTLLADASSGIVSQINDATQTQVDTLGERGLYGLNLVAQQLQVSADIQKQGFDQQISVAQQQLDSLQASADAAENAAQINMDQVTAAQDLLVAQAQQTMDTITIAQDSKIAAAQAHVDSVTQTQDLLVQQAQTVVDLSANAPRAQQDAASAQLKKATNNAALVIQQWTTNLQTVTDTANNAINNATQGYTIAQNNQANAIQSATTSLSNITGYFNNAIAQSQGSLQGIENTAAQAEATSSGGVSVAQAQASTEFAGSGLVVNFYGADLSNPTAIQSNLDWFVRNQLPS